MFRKLLYVKHVMIIFQYCGIYTKNRNTSQCFTLHVTDVKRKVRLRLEKTIIEIFRVLHG